MGKKYDVIIIGGGAGLKIARPAADLGFKVAVIEKDRLGGTCLNRGCIPSKMLIHPADVIAQINEAATLNIQVDSKPILDIEKLVQLVSNTVDEESQSIEPLLENHPNIDFYRCEARFTAPNQLQVRNEKIYGEKIFIAVGTRPYLPPIRGLEKTPYMTSTELLRAQKLPRSVAIVGAGYIACELGHYLHACGIEVHFIVRSQFLRNLDTDLQQHFTEIFSKRFKVSYFAPQRVNYENGKFILDDDHHKVVSEGLLIAAGVTSNADLIGVSQTNVELDSRGFIKVDDCLETTQKNIFAFGDVIGRSLFRHSANFEGEYLLEAQFKKCHAKPISYPAIPYGVFTWPQVAGVGKQEKELIEEKKDYFVGVNAYKNSAMGMALRNNEGMVKLIFERGSEKLIGGHIVGEQATTMIHMIIAYMKMGATLQDLLSTIYIHPALPENIRNAARRAQENS